MVIDLQKLRRSIARRDKANDTARERAGRPVRSIEELASLARDRRAVFCRNCWGLLPAVAVMNMAANQVHRAIQAGEIRRY